MGVPPVERPRCLPGRLAPLSAGKDTTVGHWEHMGLVTEQAFPTYPQGFPEEILAPFRERIGRGVLGNKTASGTAIIAELGEEHLQNGRPIVYTSADSVFQIAAHVDIVPLELLYEWCETARELLTGPHAVARVIARPFAGSPGAFVRTKDRRDFSLAPPAPTYLELLQEAGVPVVALGKISEVFLGKGVSTKLKVGSNEENLALIIDLLAGTSDQGDVSRGPAVHQSGGLRHGVGTSQRSGRLRPRPGRGRPGLAPHTRTAGTRRPADPVRRPRGGSHHGQHRPQPGVRAPLALPPAGRGAGRRLRGRGSATPAQPSSPTSRASEPPLSGAPVDRLRPARGWRRYTPAQTSPSGFGPDIPGRVGPVEALEAAEWLHERLGAPPSWAVVLGSGLAEAFPDLRRGRRRGRPSDDLLSRGAPLAHGRGRRAPRSSPAGRDLRTVGSSYFGAGSMVTRASTSARRSRRCAHWQRGEWRGVVLSSAAGAVTPGLTIGDQVLVREIVDLQERGPDGAPSRLPASDPFLVKHLRDWSVDADRLRAGVHAVVPGPHYETAAELDALRVLGVDCVSMSLAAEVRAAQEEGMTVVAFAVISNAGPPSHDEVLAGAGSAGERFGATVARLLSFWHRMQER